MTAFRRSGTRKALSKANAKRIIDKIILTGSLIMKHVDNDTIGAFYLVEAEG